MVTSPVRRLMQLTHPYRGRLTAALAAVLVGSAFALTAPVLVRYLVDAIVPGGDPRGLRFAAAALAAVFVGQSLFRMLSSYLLAFVGERVVADLRLQLFEHLQGLSLAFFGERRTGELTSRFTNDVTAVRGLVADNAAAALFQSLIFGGALTLIVITDWRLTLAMLGLIPLVLLLAIPFGRHLRTLSTRVQDELAVATTVLEESISGVRVVKSFQREGYETGRYRTSVDKGFRLAMRRARLGASFGPLITLLFLGAALGLLWLGGHAVLEGRLSVGQLVTFLVLTLMLAGSVSQLSGLWARFQYALGAAHRLFELLETRPQIYDRPDAVTLPSSTGRIQFCSVSFSYSPQRPEAFALRDIDLEVAPGEVLALVGRSGAGKTTLLNLIPRFYDPVEGEVRIDGFDLRQVTVDSLRRQIGVVPQETHLFGGTVRENLLYGRLDAGEDEVIAAARAANADEFIRALPDGYDSLVGERGLRLSGGQRQRIAIARAILKDPRILLLDEATSSLDSESEGLVQEALDHLMAGRTTLVIAHRLSTVQRAHRIAVLGAGRLVELGTHGELLAAGGLYAHLYRLQFADAGAGTVPGIEIEAPGASPPELATALA